MSTTNPGASGLKTVNKLARRAKYVKKNCRSYGQFDRTFKNPYILSASPPADELMRKAERRADRAFGNDAVAQKPTLAQVYVATSLARVSIGGGQYNIQLTMPNTSEDGFTGAGLLVNDIVEIIQQNSALEGHYLSVTDIVDSSHIRLQDFPGLAVPAVKQVDTVTTTADTAGSLNSKDWYINSVGNATQYYVWYNVNGAGVDPTVGGKTGIMVSLATGASANTVASLTATALNAVLGTPWVAVASGATITITWSTGGAVTTVVDGAAATSFAFAQVTAGANVNNTPAAETNVAVRFEESSIKKSYY